jgi:serine/threonine protein kinase
VRNQTCGIEVDLWALGVVLFQMLLGYTPYGGPSPYLTFLRIKRSFLQVLRCGCRSFAVFRLAVPADSLTPRRGQQKGCTVILSSFPWLILV